MTIIPTASNQATAALHIPQAAAFALLAISLLRGGDRANRRAARYLTAIGPSARPQPAS